MIPKQTQDGLNYIDTGKRHDPINHPSHYTGKNGVECIQVTEQFNFNRGNAIKYIWRAGEKNVNCEIEDLKKAIWYIEREIKRIENNPKKILTYANNGGI